MTDDDWRLTDQDRYLAGRTVRRAVWSPHRDGWDHDHCSFCWAEISDRPVDEHSKYNAAWVTEDNYHWICPQCFDDFRERFRWQIEAEP